MKILLSSALVLVCSQILPVTSAQVVFHFDNGNPNGLIATASRPSGPGKTEIETADDFLLTDATVIKSATFTGLLPSGFSLSGISSVDVEIYRVFPLDSSVPASSTVPTRANSPSDVEFEDRDSGDGSLTFSAAVLNSNFTVSNSVQAGGINPVPNQLTGGGGPLAGEETLFQVTFTTPFSLAAGHYFFVPQVTLTSGDFYWLSSVRPIVAPGTPFAPDLQSWIRSESLSPNWLRVGTDIIGGTTFNAAFSLDGTTTAAPLTAVPEPSTYGAMGALVLVGGALLKRKKRSAV